MLYMNTFKESPKHLQSRGARFRTEVVDGVKKYYLCKGTKLLPPKNTMANYIASKRDEIIQSGQGTEEKDKSIILNQDVEINTEQNAWKIVNGNEDTTPRWIEVSATPSKTDVPPETDDKEKTPLETNTNLLDSNSIPSNETPDSSPYKANVPPKPNKDTSDDSQKTEQEPKSSTMKQVQVIIALLEAFRVSDCEDKEILNLVKSKMNQL
eukprot:TRINITY_DN12245_c0_g1_i1.p1 TRINITY_DN12245_c0_g1~~TRINITY_DN12245_c0_g1_i1.p1  ORF type:complete len:210 (-),score=49.95 TRINITY_DN12245_c0_g1_i1:91-720(-)